MATIPVNNCVSIAGVLDQRRPARNARATRARPAAAPNPIKVIAMPLASWYDCPCAVAMAASTEATTTPAASTASTMAATRTERGSCPADWLDRATVFWAGWALTSSSGAEVGGTGRWALGDCCGVS